MDNERGLAVVWNLHDRPVSMAPSTGTWDALRATIAREQTVVAMLVVGYFLAGRLGLELADTYSAVSLIWPCSGIALGAVLLLGYRVWPVVFLSAVALYASVLGPEPAVLGLAAGNTSEGLLAAYLVNRYAAGLHALQNPRNCLWFAGVVLLTCMITSATFNAVTLVISQLEPATEYTNLWLVQGAGSLSGVLLVTPLILYYSQGVRGRFKLRVSVESAVVTALLLVTSTVVFFWYPLEIRGFPNELLCLPLLLWAALRLGRRMASVALVLLAIVAIAGTIGDSGPFFRGTQLGSLAVAQFFLVLSSVMTLLMAALASEYSVAEAQLRELVVTDPLTGLPNYRRLLEVLSAEIATADRHKRPFAVVFFDMDGLKRINDDMGHLVGSRAVCRFAETLRAACRTTDTPARYGGDEFVAVLSDTDQAGARLVVDRTMQRLSEDTAEPKLSVSAGIAMYPRDGSTPTTLLSAADRSLYAVKAQKSSTDRRVVELQGWTSAS